MHNSLKENVNIGRYERILNCTLLHCHASHLYVCESILGAFNVTIRWLIFFRLLFVSINESNNVCLLGVSLIFAIRSLNV